MSLCHRSKEWKRKEGAWSVRTFGKPKNFQISRIIRYLDQGYTVYRELWTPFVWIYFLEIFSCLCPQKSKTLFGNVQIYKDSEFLVLQLIPEFSTVKIRRLSLMFVWIINWSMWSWLKDIKIMNRSTQIVTQKSFKSTIWWRIASRGVTKVKSEKVEL